MASTHTSKNDQPVAGSGSESDTSLNRSYAAWPHNTYAQTAKTVKIKVGDVEIEAPAKVDLPSKKKHIED